MSASVKAMALAKTYSPTVCTVKPVSESVYGTFIQQHAASTYYLLSPLPLQATKEISKSTGTF